MGESCGPCFNEQTNFDCGECEPGLECVKNDKNDKNEHVSAPPLTCRVIVGKDNYKKSNSSKYLKCPINDVHALNCTLKLSSTDNSSPNTRNPNNNSSNNNRTNSWAR